MVGDVALADPCFRRPAGRAVSVETVDRCPGHKSVIHYRVVRRNAKAYLRPVPAPSLPVAMALDPLELAKQLEQLRVSRSQSKEKAAQFVGISIRQYRRLTSNDPPPARLSTVEKVADAYQVEVGDLVAAVTHTDGTLTARLERLETKVDQILGLWRTEALPALARLEAEAQIAEATRPTGRSSPAKGRRARAS